MHTRHLQNSLLVFYSDTTFGSWDCRTRLEIFSLSYIWPHLREEYKWIAGLPKFQGWYFIERISSYDYQPHMKSILFGGCTSYSTHCQVGWPGGTIVLDSLLCKHINVGQRLEDLFNKTTEVGNHINEGARSSGGYVAYRLCAFLETKNSVKFVLFFFVMLGTCLVIGDAILTPAISGGNLSPACKFELFGQWILESCIWDGYVIYPVNDLNSLSLLRSLIKYGRSSKRESTHLELWVASDTCNVYFKNNPQVTGRSMFNM